MLFVTARDKNEGEVGYMSNDRDVTLKKILRLLFYEEKRFVYNFFCDIFSSLSRSTMCLCLNSSFTLFLFNLFRFPVLRGGGVYVTNRDVTLGDLIQKRDGAC